MFSFALVCSLFCLPLYILSFSFDDPFEFESKTLTSAVKTFFRNLPEPIMTFKLHSMFIAAASKSVPTDNHLGFF
jgi:hypothetical protein